MTIPELEAALRSAEAAREVALNRWLVSWTREDGEAVRDAVQLQTAAGEELAAFVRRRDGLLATHAVAGFVALRNLLKESEGDCRELFRLKIFREATDAEIAEAFAEARAALAPVEHLLPKE